MEHRPKENFLPAVIAGGVMMVCCFAPVLFILGGAGLAAWFSGISLLLVAGIAVAGGIVILLFLRIRNTASTETQHASPTTALKGDQ